MKKVIRLTESELIEMVEKIVFTKINRSEFSFSNFFKQLVNLNQCTN